LEKYQIIHQVGHSNYKEVRGVADLVLEKNQNKGRYHAFDYLNVLALRMSAGISEMVISRAGSTIFEIAAWGLPAIIIPFTDSNGDHSRKNAYAFARAGACIVIEEKNLTPNLITSEIDHMMENPDEKAKMGEAAREFATPDAARKIADEIINIVLKHEK